MGMLGLIDTKLVKINVPFKFPVFQEMQYCFINPTKKIPHKIKGRIGEGNFFKNEINTFFKIKKITFILFLNTKIGSPCCSFSITHLCWKIPKDLLVGEIGLRPPFTPWILTFLFNYIESTNYRSQHYKYLLLLCILQNLLFKLPITMG